MKKVLTITTFIVSLLINPLFSSVVQAETNVKTIITPFNDQQVKESKEETNKTAIDENTHEKNNQVKHQEKDLAYKVTPEEIDLLAHMVYAEARGESKEGEVAVAAVILNRTKDIKFPKTVREIMFEPDAFTAVSDGQFYMKPNKTAYEAVYDALKGDDPTGGAVYYWNPKTATSGWVWSRTVIKQIGQHIFAK